MGALFPQGLGWLYINLPQGLEFFAVIDNYVSKKLYGTNSLKKIGKEMVARSHEDTVLNVEKNKIKPPRMFKVVLLNDDSVSYTHLTLPTNREV